ncbi:MAG: DUF6504 family protein [Pseudomonadota bacterium]
MRFCGLEVEAYSGFKVNERPLAFFWEGRKIVVSEVLDRWFEGGRTERDQRLDYFKVRTRDGEEYILRYNGLFDAWSLLVR